MRRALRARRGSGPPRAGLVDGELVVFFDHDDPIAALRGAGTVTDRVVLADSAAVALPPEWRLLPPIEAPEVWCAGVTYARSRDARLEETRGGGGDAYERVYNAERPELFLKDAAMRRTVGPGDAISLRSDSRWMIPEPELAVVLGEGGTPVAVTVGNDVSSRDIEGENPLYLPQAKIFHRCCAFGPALSDPGDWNVPFAIEMRIADAAGAPLFAGRTTTSLMRRSPHELAGWLVRDNPVPAGSVLLTGTGIVPPAEFTLEPGHVVEIEIDGVGCLRNVVA